LNTLLAEKNELGMTNAIYGFKFTLKKP